MRYCLNCHRITAGEPLFCNYCGRSYDVRLCPSRHVNPRTAEVCSECGSRDFSTPAPRTPIWLIPLLWLVRVVPGVILLLLSISLLFGVIQALISNQQLLFQLMLVGLLLGFLWYLYMQLPSSIRRLFHTIEAKRRRRTRDHR